MNSTKTAVDAEAIYLFVGMHDILPLYYEHGGKNYSENGCKYIKNSIAQSLPSFLP